MRYKRLDNTLQEGLVLVNDIEDMREIPFGLSNDTSGQSSYHTGASSP